MAITKPIKNPPHSFNEVAKLIAYEINTKDGKCFATTGLDCSPNIEAAKDFETVRKSWGKCSGVYAYHYVQSFAPDEITPERAHEIGIQLADEAFRSRGWQVIVGTHVDTDAIHNHFAVNSVNMDSGKKLNPDRTFNYVTFRNISDRLCRLNNLSVVEEPQNKGLPYEEWNADKNGGKLTRRGQIRNDIDKVIPTVQSFNGFLVAMEQLGYKTGRRGKYLWISPADSDVHFRFYKLGKGYTEEEIVEKILYPNGPISFHATHPSAHTATAVVFVPRQYHYRGVFQFHRRHHRITLRGQYFHYLCVLRRLTNSPPVYRQQFPRATSEDILKASYFANDLKILTAHNINTEGDLLDFYNDVSSQLQALYCERNELRASLRDCKSNVEEKKVVAKIKDISSKAKDLQADRASCERIFERSKHIVNARAELEAFAKERRENQKDKQPEQKQSQKQNKSSEKKGR